MDEQNTSNPYDGTPPSEPPKIRRKLPLFLKRTVILLVAISVLAAVLRFGVPILYYRLYFGNRIKGEITITVDGEPAQIIADSVYIMGEDASADTSFVVSADGMRIATKADTDGFYFYTFEVKELPEMCFKFWSYRRNWESIIEFKLHYDINTAENLVEYRTECVYLRTFGKKDEPKIHTDFYALDEDSKAVCVCLP